MQKQTNSTAIDSMYTKTPHDVTRRAANETEALGGRVYFVIGIRFWAGTFAPFRSLHQQLPRGRITQTECTVVHEEQSHTLLSGSIKAARSSSLHIESNRGQRASYCIFCCQSCSEVFTEDRQYENFFFLAFSL